METLRSTTLEAVDRLTTASSGVWPWVELARRRDLDLDAFCRARGIELARIREPFARWSQRTCNSIAQFVCEQLGSHAAMAAALTAEAGHFQLLELLIRTAPTVSDGLRFGCAFFPLLHDGGKLVHERLPDAADTVVWIPPTNFPVHQGYVELTFAMTVHGIRRETRCRHAAATEVCLRSPQPASTAAYEQVLGCTPQFEAAIDRIVFDRRVTALNMARSNREVHAKARQLARELIDSDERD